MKKKSYLSFKDISNEIINNDKYKELKNENHHGITRYEHSIRVAKITYNISKIIKIDYITATRAALLHDFYNDKDFDDYPKMNKGKLHPKIASINAEKLFSINSKEQNAIETHMFPMLLNRPASIEAVILNIVDSIIAVYECSRFKLNKAIKNWLMNIYKEIKNDSINNDITIFNIISKETENFFSQINVTLDENDPNYLENNPQYLKKINFKK